MHYTINTLLFFYTNWSFFSAVLLYFVLVFLLKVIFYLSESNQALYLVHKTMKAARFRMEVLTHTYNSSPILCYNCDTCSSTQSFGESLLKLINKKVCLTVLCNILITVYDFTKMFSFKQDVQMRKITESEIL